MDNRTNRNCIFSNAMLSYRHILEIMNAYMHTFNIVEKCFLQAYDLY